MRYSRGEHVSKLRFGVQFSLYEMYKFVLKNRTKSYTDFDMK